MIQKTYLIYNSTPDVEHRTLLATATSIKEAALIIQKSERTVSNYVKSGIIEVITEAKENIISKKQIINTREEKPIDNNLEEKVHSLEDQVQRLTDMMNILLKEKGISIKV